MVNRTSHQPSHCTAVYGDGLQSDRKHKRQVVMKSWAPESLFHRILCILDFAQYDLNTKLSITKRKHFKTLEECTSSYNSKTYWGY